MRALTARATDAERAAVEAWTASSPENARTVRELRQMLDDIEAWYRATPLRAPPTVEMLLRRARFRQAQRDSPPPRAEDE